MESKKIVNNVEYASNCPDELIDIFERMFNSPSRVIIDYGNVLTGESWGETCDNKGYLRRSGGDIKLPILVYNNRSFGGGAILTGCILSIKYANKKEGGGNYIYKAKLPCQSIRFIGDKVSDVSPNKK